jgi:hypothetical protein
MRYLSPGWCGLVHHAADQRDWLPVAEAMPSGKD